MDFNIIYKYTHIQEAQPFQSASDFFKIIDDGTYGNAEYFNGKKNLPNWVKNLDNEDRENLSDSINHVISKLKGNVNFIVTLIIKKSDSLSKLYQIVQKSIDTLEELSKVDLKASWLRNLDSYKKVISNPYDETDWKSLEKEILDNRTIKSAKKGTLTNTSNLYDLIIDKGDWKLYIPKNFEGDKELALHIKPFTSEGKTYNKARWCTAADEDYFDYYTYKGNKLYVIKHFENGICDEMYQIAFHAINNIEFMDKQDFSIDMKGNNISYLLDNCDSQILEAVKNDCPNCCNSDSLYEYVSFCKTANISYADFTPSLYFRHKISDGLIDKIRDCKEEWVICKNEEDQWDLETVVIENGSFVLNLPSNLSDSIYDNLSCYKKVASKYSVVLKNCRGSSLSIIDKKFFKDIRDLTLEFDPTSNSTLIGLLDSEQSMFSNLEKLVLKNCEQIGNSFFKGSKLKTVQLDSRLKRIHSKAFKDCIFLTDINLEDTSIDYISTHAFYNCSSLEHISLPSSLKTIDGWGFSNCTSLKSVDLKEGTTYIGQCTFAHTPSLQRINLPNSLQAIQGSAFYDCGLNELIIPKGCICSSTTFGELEGDGSFIEGIKYIPKIKIYKGQDERNLHSSEPYSTEYHPSIEYLEESLVDDYISKRYYKI